MKRLYELEHLVWMGIQTKSPFLPMYKQWMWAELKRISDLPEDQQINLK